MTSVATVITRLEGGAGVLALRGVLGLDRSAFEPVIVTGSGGRLLDLANANGVEVIVHPVLKATIDPVNDPRAVRWLARLAARRAGIRRIGHIYHGFPVPRIPVARPPVRLHRA